MTSPPNSWQNLLFICVTLLMLQASHSFFFSDPKKATTDYTLTMTSIPRASYKISKDSSSSFWIAVITVQDGTDTFPMFILPYTSSSWVSNKTLSDSNIDAVNCEDEDECIIIAATINNRDSQDFFNYSLVGPSAYVQACPYTYTTLFTTQVTNTPPVMNPPLTIIGGLGLGIDLSDEFSDGTSSSFIDSFYDLENYVAGIYLSNNNFDSMSELLVGDYNIAYINVSGYNTTIAPVDPSTWSFDVMSILDNNGNVYYNASTQPNYTQVIFDPNLNAIGVPQGAYDQFLTTFVQLGCQNTTSFPICNCDGTVFPDLYLNYGSNNQSLVISPDIYLNEAECSLLIISTDQANVTQTYSSAWVLGSPVMTYYYTVLNWTDANYTISLYQVPSFHTNPTWYIIVGAVSLVVLIVGLFACIAIIRQGKQNAEEPLVSNVEIVGQEANGLVREDQERNR